CSLSATVDIIERLGNETYIYVNDANDDLLTVVGDGELDVSNKEQLKIHFTTDQCHLFGRDDQSIQ
ncbi:MAG: TOBE domain-containing protein, partial [SAR324 cluster bacterium]|nr:TOBE domain-containing protein [SAR324 cluster bacterium]